MVWDPRIELHLEPDLELADANPTPFNAEEIRRCKIVSTILRCKAGKFQQKSVCLIVFETDFLPFYGVRFKYAEIELRLVKASAQSQGQLPTVITYAPRRWLGRQGAKNIQEGAHAGLNTGVATQAFTGANVGVDAGVDRTISYAELKRARVDSEHQERIITWRLSENDVTHEGIPRPFLGAVIVAGLDDVALRVKYYVKLSQSANPLTWVPGHARMSEPLVLEPALIKQGIGKDVDGVEGMEQDSFELNSLAPANWDM
jgi:hypothetical protein